MLYGRILVILAFEPGTSPLLNFLSSLVTVLVHPRGSVNFRLPLSVQKPPHLLQHIKGRPLSSQPIWREWCNLRWELRTICMAGDIAWHANLVLGETTRKHVSQRYRCPSHVGWCSSLKGLGAAGCKGAGTLASSGKVPSSLVGLAVSASSNSGGALKISLSH